MEHGIHAASGDQRHLLRLGMQTQFQHAGGGVAHPRDVAIRKPAMDQTDHLVRPHRDGCVSRAEPFAHRRRRREHAQERQRSSLRGPRQRHDHRHHDPTDAWTAHRAFCAGTRTVAVMASCAELLAPPPLQGVIDDQIHAGAFWHNGFDEEPEELAAHRERRPACSSEDVVKEAPGPCLVMAAGSQGCCNGAASMGQQRCRSYRHPCSPRRSRTPWSKGRQNVSHGVGKGQEHAPGSDGAVISFSLPSRDVPAWFFPPTCTNRHVLIGHHHR
jgi:hypothetical protein